MLPKINGLTILEKLRNDYNKPEIPFLMITSSSDLAVVSKASLNGVSNYIVKPMRKGELEEKLYACFEKHQIEIE